MLEIKIHNMDGQEVETVQVDEAKLGGEVRHALLKQAMVMFHANQRQGSAKTKTRGEVEGSTRKIYRQKGTGGARMGSVRNPVRVGGGHAKAKSPKSWRLDMPKKQRQLANKSAILTKFQAGDVIVIDQFTMPEPKTKHVAALQKKLGIDRSCLFALADGTDPIVARASRNIDRLTLTSVKQLNAWDVLRNRTLLMTKDGLNELFA